jgi:hypothetical protein
LAGAVRSRLHALEVPLLVITFVLGVYLAAANILLAVNVPKNTWVPWTGWFVALLVSAVLGPARTKPSRRD